MHCRFVNSPGGCRFGDRCRYSHHDLVATSNNNTFWPWSWSPLTTHAVMNPTDCSLTSHGMALGVINLPRCRGLVTLHMTIRGTAVNAVAMVPPVASYYTQGSSTTHCTHSEDATTTAYHALTTGDVPISGDVVVRLHYERHTCLVTACRRTTALSGFPCHYLVAVGFGRGNVLRVVSVDFAWQRRAAFLLCVMLLKSKRCSVKENVVKHVFLVVVEMLPWDILRLVFEWI